MGGALDTPPGERRGMLALLLVFAAVNAAVLSANVARVRSSREHPSVPAGWPRPLLSVSQKSGART